ncbi:MAG: MlaD family protein [Betaproteobacteria bacterium]|nr:MlaD family protein [Betaproteobacteria bacterium]
MEPAPLSPPEIRRAELKAAVVLAITLAIAAGFVIYVLFARGVFERTQALVLMAEDGAGVTVGMDLTFSGFPVGRVQKIELAGDGKARIEIDVPEKDARWLRASSVFTLERSLVGGARLRAFTGNLADKPLPDGAIREVLRGDATDELPGVIASAKRLLENLERMSAEDSALNASLASSRVLMERMSGPQGALGGLLGSEENARKVITAVDRANATLASLEKVSTRLDGVLQKADESVFGSGGVMEESRKTVVQLNATLAEARESLRKVDAILADAQKITASTRAATDDLAGLRLEVEASLRRVSALIDEINRKWPFSRDTEVKLP